MAVEIDNFDFDPEYLRKKYREERDKRLRQDGNEQYYVNKQLETSKEIWSINKKNKRLVS